MKRFILNFICLCFAVFMGTVLLPSPVSSAAELSGESISPGDSAGKGSLEEDIPPEGEDLEEPEGITEKDPDQTSSENSDAASEEAAEDEDDSEDELSVKVVDERLWTDEETERADTLAEFSELSETGEWILTIRDSEGREIRAKIEELISLGELNYSGIKTYDITMVNLVTGETISKDFGTCDILLPVERDSVDFDLFDVKMLSVSDDGSLKAVIKTIGLTGTDGSKYILFTTDHFSEYALVYSKKDSVSPPAEDSGNGNAPPGNNDTGQGSEDAGNINTPEAVPDQSQNQPAENINPQPKENEVKNNTGSKTPEVKNNINTENIDQTGAEAEVTEETVTQAEVETEIVTAEEAEIDFIEEEEEDTALLQNGSTETTLVLDSADESLINNTTKGAFDTSSESLFGIVFPIMMTVVIITLFYGAIGQLEKQEEEEKKKKAEAGK